MSVRPSQIESGWALHLAVRMEAREDGFDDFQVDQDARLVRVTVECGPALPGALSRRVVTYEFKREAKTASPRNWFWSSDHSFWVHLVLSKSMEISTYSTNNKNAHFVF